MLASLRVRAGAWRFVGFGRDGTNGFPVVVCGELKVDILFYFCFTLSIRVSAWKSWTLF